MKFHAAANVFPLLEGEEFDQFVEDIRSRGLMDAIWLHPDGSILDGRNRYRACQKAGVSPRFATWDGKGSPFDFVASMNLRRRHMTMAQKVCAAVEALPQLEEEAAQRQLASRAKPGQKIGKVVQKIAPPTDGGKSLERAATMFRVNRAYISFAKRLKKEMPDVYAEVRSGRMDLPRAMRELRKAARMAAKPSPIPAGFTGIRLMLEHVRAGFSVVDAVQTSLMAESSQFVRLKQASVEVSKSELLVTVDMDAGKFHRSIPTVGRASPTAPVNWPIKRIAPWLEYAVSIQNDIELEYSKQANGYSFRFTDDKLHVLLWVNC